jgi:hypothetical protein
VIPVKVYYKGIFKFKGYPKVYNVRFIPGLYILDNTHFFMVSHILASSLSG